MGDEVKVCLSDHDADPVEAWAEVRGETVCAVTVSASRADARELALMRLCVALVECAHQMPRTRPATGVDTCAVGKFAPVRDKKENGDG